MNTHVDLQQIELARLTQLVEREAQALVEMSDDQAEAVVEHNWIRIVFFGRGTEILGLSLPVTYSIVTRINYLADTLKRLVQIKKDLECAA